MNAPLSKEQMTLLMSDAMTVRRVAPRPSLAARLAASFHEWLNRRTVMNELRMLSDRELADIGLHRADLGRVFDPLFVPARRI